MMMMKMVKIMNDDGIDHSNNNDDDDDDDDDENGCKIDSDLNALVA